MRTPASCLLVVSLVALPIGAVFLAFPVMFIDLIRMTGGDWGLFVALGIACLVAVPVGVFVLCVWGRFALDWLAPPGIDFIAGADRDGDRVFVRVARSRGLRRTRATFRRSSLGPVRVGGWQHGTRSIYVAHESGAVFLVVHGLNTEAAAHMKSNLEHRLAPAPRPYCPRAVDGSQ
ncbi:MAG: hypothetical protein U0271_22105 [Polyangiaceae bacterium]